MHPWCWMQVRAIALGYIGERILIGEDTYEENAYLLKCDCFLCTMSALHRVPQPCGPCLRAWQHSTLLGPGPNWPRLWSTT